MSQLKIYDLAAGVWRYVSSPSLIVAVSDSPPPSPVNGALWWDTDDTSLLVDTVAPITLAADPAFTSKYVPISGGVILTDAAQTITTAVGTTITWGTEVSDPDGWISGGGGILTVPVGKGMRYAISYSGTWSAIPGTQNAVSCWINGVAVIEAGTLAAYLRTGVSLPVYTLAAGDTIRFDCYHNAGANRDITSRLEIAPI